LILWKQCHWLVNAKGFPKELETVVRDLWGLKLGVIQRAESKKDGYESGTGTMLFSSASEGESTDSDATGGKSLASRRSRKIVAAEERLPRLIETLGLCYLGTLLLRLPTSLGEFYKWATLEEMIYTRAVSILRDVGRLVADTNDIDQIKEIPREMKSKLPGHYYSALEIRAPLKEVYLHRTALELVEFYNLQFELVFPPLNYPLLLFKHMRDLGLPGKFLNMIYMTNINRQ